MGRSRSRPLKAHRKSEHFTRRFRGWFWLGESLKESRLNAFPHHGQFSRGTGGKRVSFARHFSVRRRAVLSSLSPCRVLPIRFGVADFPTHNPISKGQSPRLTLRSVCRINSSAQISVAARPNWSSVSNRSVFRISPLVPAPVMPGLRNRRADAVHATVAGR